MTESRRRLGVLICAGLLLAVSCNATRAEPPAAMTGDEARPAAARWLRSELYFAIGRIDSPDPADDRLRWQAFLDDVVTPAFPDGFTVFDGYGQWLARDSDTPYRLDTRVLVILHDDGPEAIARVESLRIAWKSRHGDDSVLRATQAVDVSF